MPARRCGGRGPGRAGAGPRRTRAACGQPSKGGVTSLDLNLVRLNTYIDGAIKGRFRPTAPFPAPRETKTEKQKGCVYRGRGG